MTYTSLPSTISYKHILNIAFPIILGSLAQNVIALADTMFLGHYGETFLAAGSLSAIFYQVVIMFLTGFGIGTQIIISRRMGEGLPRSVGRIFYHSVCFMLFAAVVIFLLFQAYGELMLENMIKTDAIRCAVSDFLHVRVFGLPFAFVAISFNSFYVGTARTKTISIATLTMGIVNIILDYFLIFGIGPFPQMGMKGAALASVIAEGVGLLVYIAASQINTDNKRKYRLFTRFPLRFAVFKKMLGIAYPLMFEYLISFGNYFVFFLMIERLGQHPLAVANITRSLYTIFLLPIWGYAATVSSVTAFLCGQKKEEFIPILIKRCLLLGFISVSLLTIPYLFIHDFALSCFTSDISLVDESFIPSLIVVSATYASVWAQLYFNSIIGKGKTGVAFIIELATLAAYIGYSAYTILYLKSSVAVAFTSEFVYVLLLGIVSVLYIRFKRRKG